MTHKHKLFLSLFIVGCMLSCTINDKDFQIKGVQTDPTLVAPLATGDLSILDILGKQDSARIKVASDGLVYLDYDTLLFKFNDIRKLVDIPSIANIPTALPVPQGTYPANQNDYVSSTASKPVDMGISPEKLTEIGFKSGHLTYSMSLSPTNNKFLYALRVSIPEFLSSTGQPFSQDVNGSGTIQLSGYTFKSANANKFTLNLALVIKKNSQSVNITAGTNLNVNVSFAGMDFTYIVGFFGDQIANPPAQSVSLPPFSTSFKNGATISFAQPSIDLNVISEYGVPLTVTFSYINATKPGSTMAMQTNPASTSQIPITAPTTLGTSATTSVPVTNVKQLIDFEPTGFSYKVSGHINSGLTSGTDFMADTSSVRVRMHTQIPLYGKASNIVLADTIDFSLGDLDQSKIESASLKTYVVNELPIDANLQFIVTDENYVFIDSLLTDSQTSLVKGSTVDSNGDLLAAGKIDEFIPLDADKVTSLFKAKKIIMKARLNTIKNSSGVAVDVKFKSQYKINMKLGLRTTVKLNTTF